MGKYSALLHGKRRDFRHKRLRENNYAFYLGKIYIGQTFKESAGWAAVSSKPNELGVVNGFISRHKAIDYLIKVYKLYIRKTVKYVESKS